MKGRIVFWFNLLPPNFNIGIVTIKLFGQKCEVCKMEVYEQPMWYPEEVTKVICPTQPSLPLTICMPFRC